MTRYIPFIKGWGGILLIAALALASCAPVTQQIDETTGTTLAERCQTRRAAIAAWDEMEKAGFNLGSREAELRTVYRIYVASVCPPVG